MTQTDQIHHRAQLLDMVMQSASEGMVIVRNDKKVLYANPSMEKITGFSCDELVNEGEGFLRHELDENACKEICDIAHNADHFRREVTVHKKQGGEIHILLSLDTLRNDQGEIEYFVGLLTDITEVRNSRQKLEYMATHDILTRLPNRTMLEDRLQQAITRAKRHNRFGALLFLDLDDFKQVNDSLGHVVGDKLLRHVAQRLQTSRRKQDTVARFGGDEFVIILEDIDKTEDINVIAEKLLQSLNSAFKIEDYELNISASIGITLFPRDGRSVKELLHKADISMYEAKKSGRNRYHLQDD